VKAKLMVKELRGMGFRPAFFNAMGTNMTVKLPSDKQVFVKFTDTWAQVEIRSASLRDREQDVFVMTENKEALQMINEIMGAEKNG